MRSFRRAHLGRYFSEGARLLWRLLDKGSLTLEDLGRVGSWSRGTAHHWLYGDRRPSLSSALLLERFFKIPVTAWDKAPRRPFVPPHANGVSASTGAPDVPAAQ